MASGVTRTIRLEKDLDDLLQGIAKSDKITVNSIVNRSLRRYVDWNRRAERFGMMAIRPAIMVELIERHSVDEARQLGRLSAKESMRPAVEYIFVDFTLANVLEFLRRFSKYGGRFEFEGRKHAILIRHSLGLKWSAYYEGLLEWIFEEELGIKIRISVSPELCIGRFELHGPADQVRH